MAEATSRTVNTADQSEQDNISHPATTQAT